MKYIKLSVPAGVKWHGTAYQCEGRWHDASLMRWDQGAMLPVGGWAPYVDSKPGVEDYSPQPVVIPDDMVPREAHSWFLTDASGSNGAGYYLAVATPRNIHVMSGLGEVTTLTDGMSLPGEETPSLNAGYGGGLYGKQLYGRARQIEGQTKTPATTWTLDNYGEWLIGVSTTDQRIWCWKPNEELPADQFKVLENSPACLSLVATEERFIFALGADDGSSINVRRVAWCDREAPEVWKIDPNNEAGGFELQTDGAIRCGLRVRGRTLILTTTDAHTATYSGPPLVYGFQQVGKNCGVISDRAAAATGAGAFWMGRDGFYTYDGSAVRELPCEVTDRVFRFMDSSSYHNVFAVANAKFNEIVWFYTSSDQEGEVVILNPEETDPDKQIKVIKKVNNRYVSYDYAQNIWSIGEISRHAGVDSGIFNDPLWLDAGNNVYRHELENVGHINSAWTSKQWHGWTTVNGPVWFDEVAKASGNRVGGQYGADEETFIVANTTLPFSETEQASVDNTNGFWRTGAKIRLSSIADSYGSKPSSGDLKMTIPFDCNWDATDFDGEVRDLLKVRATQGGRIIGETVITSQVNESGVGYVGGVLELVNPSNDQPLELALIPESDLKGYLGFFAFSVKEISYQYGNKPFAESGPISIGEGDAVIKATQVLTDSIPENRVTLEFKTRFQPQGEEITFGPYDVKPQTDVRFTGRQMRMRVNVIDDENGAKDVRVGDMRVLISGGGRR